MIEFEWQRLRFARQAGLDDEHAAFFADGANTLARAWHLAKTWARHGINHRLLAELRWALQEGHALPFDAHDAPLIHMSPERCAQVLPRRMDAISKLRKKR